MAGKINIKSWVEEKLEALATEGFEVWNVEYVKEGKDKQLRVFVDKEGGIGIDGCETVSRFLSEKLDTDGPIGEAYSLVVSSPGMDRILLKDEHYARYIGVPVDVALYRGFNGLKKFPALLGEKTEDSLKVTPIDVVSLAPIGEEMTVPLELVSQIRLMVVI